MKRVLLALLVLFAAAGTATAREQLRVAVASSTLDGVGAIASRFARNTGLPVPALEVTGSAIAFDLFCAGVGFEHVDVVTASRRMSTGEHAKCEKNGVTSITEIEIGRDALVLASGPGAKPMSLVRKNLYAAVARNLPSAGAGEAVSPNAAQQWSDVDPALPKRPIRFIGPSPKSAQMADFLELAMVAGCSTFPGTGSLASEQREVTCRALRQDDHYEEGPKNAAQVLDALRSDPDSVAVLPYSFYAAHRDDLTAHAVDGVAPTEHAIARGRYPLIEPVYVYVKNQHMGRVPGLQRLVYEFTSERAISPTGYVAETGLVALDDIGRNRARDTALSLPPWRPAP